MNETHQTRARPIATPKAPDRHLASSAIASFGLLASAVIGAGCVDAIDRITDCHDICARYADCFDSTYDVGKGLCGNCRSDCRSRLTAEGAA